MQKTLNSVDLLEIQKALARKEFFSYCNLKAPEFYQEDRKFLKNVCNDFQNFYEGNEEVMIINMPPR